MEFFRKMSSWRVTNEIGKMHRNETKTMDQDNSMEELDIVFCVDCTSSMTSYIHAAQENVQSIIQTLGTEEAVSVRFGLIAYRDHPPQDRSFVTKKFDFTNSIEKMQQNVDWMVAQGGGDGPESVCCAYNDALRMTYRPNAAKIVVHIADAPPHGLGEHGDGFPNGCPKGHDPLAIARKMGEKGIVVYTVGCEPSLGFYRFARDFMVAVAETTQGQAVTLASSSLLANVILHGAQEEIELERIMAVVDAETENVRQDREVENRARVARGESIDEDAEEEVVKQQVWTNLQKKQIKTRQMKTDQQIHAPMKDALCRNSSLSSWRAELASVSMPMPSESCHLEISCSSHRKKSAHGWSLRKKLTLREKEESADTERGSISFEEDEEESLDERGSISCEEGEEQSMDGAALSLNAHSSMSKNTAATKVYLETNAISMSQVSRAMGKQKLRNKKW